MALFDIKAVEDEVRQELAEQKAAEAKEKIKLKLVQISKAERVLQTLQMEYKDLIAQLAADAE